MNDAQARHRRRRLAVPLSAARVVVRVMHTGSVAPGEAHVKTAVSECCKCAESTLRDAFR